MQEAKSKNPKNIAKGKKRWAGRSKDEMLKHMQMMGSKGGKETWRRVRLLTTKNKGVDNQESPETTHE